LTFNNFK